MRNELGTYNRAPIKPQVFYETDFNRYCHSATDNTNEWFATLNTGTVALADSGTNGLVVITTHTTDNSVVNMQMPGEAYKLAAGKNLQFRAANLKLTVATEANFFIGLSITDTTILTGTVAPEGSASDAIGFMWDGTGLKLYAVASKNGTTTWTSKIDTGIALVANTFIEELSFNFDGNGKALFYVNGALVATIDDQAATKTLYSDDEDLTPSIEVQTTADGVAKVLTLDYLAVEMDR